MENGTREGTDGSSIKPVSSLRSMFENKFKDQDQASPNVQPKLLMSAQAQSSDAPPSRASLDLTRPAINLASKPQLNPLNSTPQPLATGPRKRRPSPPKSRPMSMVSLTPKRSPPLVMVESPRSPVKNMSLDLRAPSAMTMSPSMRPLTPNSGSASPGSPGRHARTLSRATTPALEARASAFLQAADSPKLAPEIDATAPIATERTKLQAPGVPPPVNRAAKPKVPGKPLTDANPSNGLSLAPDNTADHSDRTISPFSTPPSSGDNSPDERRPSIVPSAGRDGAVLGFSVSSVPKEGYFGTPPVHPAVAARREYHAGGLSRTPTMPARYRPIHIRDVSAAGDLPEERPGLPPRRERHIRSGRTSPTKIPSGRTSPFKDVGAPTRNSMDMPRRAATVVDRPPVQHIPSARRAASSALAQGFDRSSPPVAAPAIPAPRRSVDQRRIPPPPAPSTNGHSHDDREESPLMTIGVQAPGPADYPDSSQANRRPPRFKHRPYQIPTDYDTRLFGVCGDYVCTTGYLTKVWSIRTGEQLVNMAHDENIKVTSMVFRPAANAEDEGKRIWLGTNIGEIHEIDVPSQSLVKSKSDAHQRREIIKMYRHATEVWSLDEGGELLVWPPDHKGISSLDSSPHGFRVPKGHSFSLASGNQLWIATGKEIRVFLPSAKSDAGFQVLQRPLSQPSTGDVTSGTTLNSKPDLIYFGHSDGKVTIYNRSDYSCAGVVNVSLYKISALTGVGDYLWAGYNTGMAYVYDTSVTPWRVRKDWHAHEKPICSIIADQSSAWKLDRLQVITLGTDNMLRIWDGMLQEDWLEDRMHELDSDYCSFREITAAVLTWNAGACKPGHLQNSRQDSNFFRDYLATNEPPDIFVFGFQELVDLEDKKMTAKSLFKSKKKDPTEQEHMSHQYRAWRDYLQRCLDDSMPTNQPYTLLHTASMVGLFTCIFVKSSERARIRHVHTAEVKRGMGGLHGNKGALVLRLILDDSSICFTNCHLAAGQTQTINRNNDIAAILETEMLPSWPLPQDSAAQHSDTFIGGGDGSMILDHEICILNGDLNYRIDTMGRDTVVKHVASNNLIKLLGRDQLLLSRKKNPGFRLRAFRENAIDFAPTYKYNVNTDEYDTSEKRRAPAWCDRILYRGIGKVKMDEYRRWEVRVSDHRPVSGRFRCRVKTVDPERRDVVWKTCEKEFGHVKRQILKATQLDYLTNNFGLLVTEATTALKG